MTRRRPTGLIRWTSNYGIGGTKGVEFIQCVDDQEPQMREIWSLGSNGVTSEFHLTAQVDVGAGAVVQFSTDYPTEMVVEPQFSAKFTSTEVSKFWISPISTEPVDSFY